MQRSQIKKIVNFALLILPFICLSEESSTENDGIEITGLMIDNTISHGGHNFFDTLSTRLNTLTDERDYTVHVIERAGIGRGTFILVQIDDTLIFNAQLNPLPDAVENMANNVAQRILKFSILQKEYLQELEYY